MPNALSLVAAALSAYGLCTRLIEFYYTVSPVSLGIAAFYAVLMVLFLFRSPSKQAETRPQAWILSLGATYLPGMIKAPDAALDPTWGLAVLVLQVLSLGGMIIALSQLGKGFGILPAVREVKTHGLYRWVRHPLYATEIAFMATILFVAPSIWNISLVILFIGLQSYRAITEEQLLLSHETVYQQYASQVKYRFIPFVV